MFFVKRLPLTVMLFFSIVAARQAELVNIEKVNPNIKLDIRYATAQNFTGQQFYTMAKCYLDKDVAKALNHAQQELEKQGLGLKIWDGYRPLAAQWKAWEILPDPKYVSDPRKGGRHTRGTAVDVTLISLADGKELEMPTEFDNFTTKAHSDYDDLSDQAKKNRQLLKNVMNKYGFEGIHSEWWHFDYQGWRDYEPMDIAFEDLD